DRASEKLNRSPELERETFALKTFWPGEAVTPVATGGRSIGEILARVKPAELPLLQYLCTGGLLTTPSSAPKGQAPAPPVDEDPCTRVNEANSVLSDANRRAEYDVYLDRREKGLPTDVGAILRAEGVFQRGEILFKSGRWEDAEGQFREAISLNHTEAEFHAFLGMAMFRRSGKPEEALPHVQKALEMEPRLQSGTIF